MNRYDRSGKCSFNGLNAELVFSNLAEEKGCLVGEANFSEQIRHSDINIKICNNIYKVDVKARKKVNRSDTSPQDDFVWLELKNVRGNKGWVFGISDFIVFEREDDFIFVKREDLAQWCTNNVKKTVVKSSKDAYKKCYQRKGRKDMITLIKKEELEQMSFRKWLK